MSEQQKIDYIYGRSVRLLDELGVDDQDRIQAEYKLKGMTTVDRSIDILTHIEYLLSVKGIECDRPADFIFQYYQ